MLWQQLLWTRGDPVLSRLLLHTGKPIPIIACDVGWFDSALFTRRFRAHPHLLPAKGGNEGVYPTQFARENDHYLGFNT